MPKKHNEKTISGTEWDRASRVIIEYPTTGVPSALFVVEKARTIDGVTDTKVIGNLSVSFAVDGSFPLLNKETGNTTGQTITHDHLEAVLYSLFIYAAEQA